MRTLRVELARFADQRTMLQLTWDYPARKVLDTGDAIIADHVKLPYDVVEVVAWGMGAGLADYLKHRGLTVREILPEPRSRLTGHVIKAVAAGALQTIDIGDNRLSAPTLLTWLLTLPDNVLLDLFRQLHELRNRGEL
jgi:hypothetical protein